MQAKCFVLLREPSDLWPSLTFMVTVGCYRGKAAVMPWPKLPESARSHTLSYYFLTGHGWMESKQIGLSPSLSRRIWQTQTYILPRAVQVCLAVRNSACAELQIYIMYEERNFPFTIAFICGVFTVKQRPS